MLKRSESTSPRFQVSAWIVSAGLIILPVVGVALAMSQRQGWKDAWSAITDGGELLIAGYAFATAALVEVLAVLPGRKSDLIRRQMVVLINTLLATLSLTVYVLAVVSNTRGAVMNFVSPWLFLGCVLSGAGCHSLSVASARARSGSEPN
jgi:hypothetical protein